VGKPGDITITPWQDHISLATAIVSVIKNPTRSDLDDVLLAQDCKDQGSLHGGDGA
jgi:hypothetical protein